jgi:hypothetical protein
VRPPFSLAETPAEPGEKRRSRDYADADGEVAIGRWSNVGLDISPRRRGRGPASCLVNRCKQGRILHGLRKKGDSACRLASLSNTRIIVRGDDDGRDHNAVAVEAVLKLQSGHSRHLQIGDQAFRQFVRERSQEIGCRAERPRLERAGPQHPCECLEHGRIVVDDRDQIPNSVHRE